MFCHNCGKQIPDNIKFCSYCGAAQDEGQQNAPASAAPPPVPPVQPQQMSWQAQPQSEPQAASWQTQSQPTPQAASWQAQSQPAQQAASWQAQSQPEPQAASWQTQSQPTPQAASWQTQSQPTPQPTAGQEQERVLPGIFGALLCSLAGVVFMILLGNLGYVSSLSGVVMLACTAWGYSHFGKVMSKRGICFSVLIVIVMIWLGNRLYWVGILMKYYSDTFSFELFLSLPMPSGAMEDAYYESLGRQYAFAAVGVILLAVNLFRGNRSGKRS